MSDPEISIGAGRSQIVLRGREAIRAAGWTLQFLLVAKAMVILGVPLAILIYALVK